MIKENFKLLVFDWDGTLMDSEQHIVASIQAVISDLDLEPKAHHEIKEIIGLSMGRSIDTLFPGENELFHSRFCERYRSHFYSNTHNPAILFDGARELIQLLHQQGYLLAIATGKGRHGLDLALKETDFQQFFHATRCADETFSKPHPQMLLDIFEQLGVEPEQALMIGDTEYDIQMAENAGASALAVTYGVHDQQRLASYKPLACLDSISELTDWFT